MNNIIFQRGFLMTPLLIFLYPKLFGTLPSILFASAVAYNIYRTKRKVQKTLAKSLALHDDK